MRDLDAAAVALALGDTALATAVASRIYGGDAPPKGYDPSAGGAVCLKSRGGPVRYDPIIDVSIQAKCYGPTAVDAWQTYQLTFNALHEKSNGVVAWSRSEVVGQRFTEPTTKREYVLAYFRMLVRP